MVMVPEITRLLDEAVRSDLQNIRDSYFFWLLVFTGLVALGVVMEEAEEFTPRKSKPEAPEGRHQHTSWLRLTAKIGWILIVVGIIGEGVFEGLVSKSDGLLQELANTLTVSAQKQAGEADERAADAELTAAGLQIDISEAGKEAEDLRLDVAKANERAESERLARARIEALLDARHLDRDQKERIAARLARYSGIAVDVFVLAQEDSAATHEAMNFGMDVVDALGKSMKVSGYLGSACQAFSTAGVSINAAQDLSQERYAAGDIAEALTAAGIEVVPYVGPIIALPCATFSNLSTRPRNRTGLAKIRVIIGKKPTPILKQR